MIFYTLGFLFNRDHSQVLLIHKRSPDWQKGKINGLGGKFEADETSEECVVREVLEETGLITDPSNWKIIGKLHSSKWNVTILTSTYTGDESDARSMEEGKTEWFLVSNLPSKCMSNLFWLIPLCRDALEKKDIQNVTVNYSF